MDNNNLRAVVRPPGQGQSKSARRRRRRRQAQTQIAQTTAPLPKKRTRTRRRVQGGTNVIATEFVRCVLDPFNHPGPLTGVPDRFAGQSIVIENRTFTDIPSGKYTYLYILPAVGYNLHYSVMNAPPNPEKLSGCNWTSMKATVCTNTFDTMRTMSLAVRVKWAGKLVDSGGYAIVTRSANFFSDVFSARKGLDDYTNWMTIGDARLGSSQLTSSPTSTTHDMTNGFYATSSRVGGDSWTFYEHDTTYWTYDNPKAGTTAGKTDQSPSVKTQFGTEPMPRPDPEWYGILLKIVLPTTTGNLIVETRHCFEATIDLETDDSAAYRTLMRPSPPANPLVLDQVARLQSQTVSAIPYYDSWFDRGMRFVGRAASNYMLGAAAPVMGALGLGMTSAPAPVSRLALQ